jgi:hypothetical protein
MALESSLMNKKARILMYLPGFPTISQTYMLNEVEALQDDYELRIVTNYTADLPCKDHHPFQQISRDEELHAIIEEFKPDILHGHYIYTATKLAAASEKFSIPFTLRTHSFDVFMLKNMSRGMIRCAANSDTCIGILAFPYACEILAGYGIKRSKLHACWPVIKYNRFIDRSENSPGVLNIGACIPKKKLEDYVELGRLTGKTLDLYSIGFQTDAMMKYNRDNGSPIHIHRAVEPTEMPQVYKQHDWLVYTACPKINTVGWSMAVPEAQAAGLGICFPNIRPDITEFLGGAGFTYDSIQEVPDIINKPYPQEMREIGFEHAKKSDIDRHKNILTDLWDSTIGKKLRINPIFNNFTFYSGMRSSLLPIKEQLQKAKTLVRGQESGPPSQEAPTPGETG